MMAHPVYCEFILSCRPATAEIALQLLLSSITVRSGSLQDFAPLVPAGTSTRPGCLDGSQLCARQVHAQ